MSHSLWRSASAAVDEAAGVLERSKRRSELEPTSDELAAELRRVVDAWAQLVGRREFRAMADPWRRGISRDDVEQVAVVAGRRAIERHSGHGPLSAYVYASASNAAMDLYRRSKVLETTTMSNDFVATLDVLEVFDVAADLLSEAFDLLVADHDVKAQRALAAAWDLATERERITIAAIAARSDLTVGEARLAWDRIKRLVATILNSGES